MRTSIQKLLSKKEEKKMIAFTSKGRAGLEVHLTFVKDLRAKSQSMVSSAADPRERSDRREDDVGDEDPAVFPTPAINTAKVLKNMKVNIKKRGAELISIPEGDSLSVLTPLKGNTKPAMGFSTVGVLMLWPGMVAQVAT